LVLFPATAIGETGVIRAAVMARDQGQADPARMNFSLKSTE